MAMKMEKPGHRQPPVKTFHALVAYTTGTGCRVIVGGDRDMMLLMKPIPLEDLERALSNRVPAEPRLKTGGTNTIVDTTEESIGKAIIITGVKKPSK